jgi:CO/xanthine dehydrogenase FAD-binding subunit
VEVIQPETWAEALDARRDRPGALALQGGTDVLVELNFDRVRPEAILDLSRVRALREWSLEGDEVRLGAGVTYARIEAELRETLPGLAMAARTVGSPQIRNRGTVAGNLGSASPAGDSHPPLLAAGAEVELASAGGVRRVPVRGFFRPGRRTVMRADELIAAVHVPIAAGGQQFSKVGARNAMVIAACSLAVALDPVRRRVGTGIGSAGPTPLWAHEAERFLEGELEARGLWDAPAPLDGAMVAAFADLVAAAARPIDDVRATAAYRRRALAVLARRAVRWAWEPVCA